MPEAEGWFGIINLLTEALKLMEHGKAKELVTQARTEAVRQMNGGVTSLEIGMDLGRLLAQEEQRDAP